MSAEASPSGTRPTWPEPEAKLRSVVEAEFAPAGVFLNSATLGLPPRRTLEAMRADFERWATGVASAPDYDAAVDSSRAAEARLHHVPVEWVAIGSQTSPHVGIVAASVPDRTNVLVAHHEFTSVSFPFLAQSGRGVNVVEVPLETLADAVDETTGWVAVAAVASADGRRADLAAIREACDRHGARMLVDTTQSAGWLDLDVSRYEVTVCSAYKWLLAPRGTSFMIVRPELWTEIVPINAGWYAGGDVWDSIYGPPLRLAGNARRYDVSPGWPAWVGTAASLGLIEEIGVPAIEAHDLGLASAAADAFGVDDPVSAVLSIDVAHLPDLEARLAGAGIRAAVRNGALRLSFHLYNSLADVEAVAAALT